MLNEKFINVFCLSSERIIASIKIGNEELIGRMKSNFYQFVGGHIYFNNQVFKIRYDLMSDGLDFNEDKIFSKYD